MRTRSCVRAYVADPDVNFFFFATSQFVFPPLLEHAAESYCQAFCDWLPDCGGFFMQNFVGASACGFVTDANLGKTAWSGDGTGAVFQKVTFREYPELSYLDGAEYAEID